MLLATFGSVMMNILYVVIAIVVLLTMVLIHELGHYIAGRILGFTITEFSIGFGKVLWQKTNKRGEKISLRLFPLGGFCAFLGENDDDSEENKDDDAKQEGKEKDKNIVDTELVKEEYTTCEYCGFTFEGRQSKCPNCKAIIKPENVKQSVKENKVTKIENLKEETPTLTANINSQEQKGVMFTDQKPWKRIIVFLAGVTFNFISAFIFAIIFLCVGAYDGYKLSPTQGYNINLYNPDSGIIERQLTENTTVYAINGTEINYARGRVFASLVPEDAEYIILTIDGTDGQKVDVKLVREQIDEKNNKIFGINYSTCRISYNFGDVLRDFVPFTLNISVLLLKAFWQIITGQIALNQLGGPISTITQMTQVASYGLANFLYLLPFLAANLAIFNILPIPGLDGAHVVFTTIEWIRGKPIKRNVENAIHGWGIICLFAFVIIIDIIHLITAGF
ncbi:MAG: site-2 protease family protein [Eubacteriales bacterium]|nr:site-2 protease family protein [Eubacteriales bacterium]